MKALDKRILVSLVLLQTAACAQYKWVEVPEEVSAAKTVSTSEVVAYGNKQVDFLLVLDDSNSMKPELEKLAAKMSNFIGSLEASDIDWQMCYTTTSGRTSANGTIYGEPKAWKSYQPDGNTPAYLLKKGISNLDQVFSDTINNLSLGSQLSYDERGIKATFENFKNGGLYNPPSHTCYREGAAISVILISDEDERSLGGDAKNLKGNESAQSVLPLEPEDLPAVLINQASQSFGSDVRFTFNSIIVKPNDIACEKNQDASASPSHPGHHYAEISRLTEGGVGSICDADYSAQLNTFKDKIVNSMTHIVLQCAPVPATLKVKINGVVQNGLKLDKKTLRFNQALLEGTLIDLYYECL